MTVDEAAETTEEERLTGVAEVVVAMRARTERERKGEATIAGEVRE